MVATIAARARESVAESGLSQRHLARVIGIDETKLSKSLSGRRRFTAEELLGLATATGVTVRWSLGDESTVSAVPTGPRDAAPAAAVDPDSPRRLIVETAWDLFARRGYDAVRIADIAEAAGVSSAAVHYHFDGKSELFDATLEFSVKLAFDRQVAWLDEIVSPGVASSGSSSRSPRSVPAPAASGRSGSRRGVASPSRIPTNRPIRPATTGGRARCGRRSRTARPAECSVPETPDR